MKNNIEDIREFELLPMTPEKKALEGKYLRGEIGSLDFYIKAKEYIRSTESKAPSVKILSADHVCELLGLDI